MNKPTYKITKDTRLCVSVAKKPGNFGTILFNKAFKKLNIDFVYKALKVKPGDLEKAIEGVRALGIRGCGVSMPYKEKAASLVDSLDPLAEKVGVINTIVNNNGKLKGYNTDAYGAFMVLKVVPNIANLKVVMFGSGGVASAIAGVLNQLKVKDVTVVGREASQAKQLAAKWKYKTEKWQRRYALKGDLFINATPIGMAPKSDATPLPGKYIDNYKIIMDVVTNPLETVLMREAKSQKKRVIIGWKMSLQQGVKQFEIYTGKKAPVELMRKSIKDI